MSIELYCIGHIHHKCSWCKNCTNDKHNAVCPYFEPIKVLQYEVISPETKANYLGDKEDKLAPLLSSEQAHKPLDTHEHDGEMVSHRSHEAETSKFDSSSCYSFGTACPDLTNLGNMQLHDEYFSAENKEKTK